MKIIFDLCLFVQSETFSTFWLEVKLRKKTCSDRALSKYSDNFWALSVRFYLKSWDRATVSDLL